MIRMLLSAIGFVMVVLPRGVVERAETVAFENPEDATLRRSTIPMARVEGAGYLLLGRRSGYLQGFLGTVVGLIGSAAAIAPRQYLTFGLSLAYENPDDITVKPWVIPGTRALGVLAVVLTVPSLRDRDTE